MADYKLHALATVGFSYRSSCDNLKIERIREVARAFIGNADRVMSAGIFPVRLLNLAQHFLPVWARAQHKVVGDRKLSREESLKIAPKIADECRRIVEQAGEKDRERFGPHAPPPQFSRRWLETLDGHPEQLQERWEGVFSILDAMVTCTGEFLAKGIESTLSGMLVGAWTAFETLAGDLWEAAVDVHPRGLSELQGKGKRKGKATNAATSQRYEEGGYIPIKRLQEYNYNVRDVMGKLLRAANRVKFTTLEEIRDAYTRAFSEHSNTVLNALEDASLDALAVARNLLVHKAGVCDSEYRRRVKAGKLRHLPQLEINQPLELDGVLVKELVSPVFMCGSRLIQAVDGWLFSDPEKERGTT